MQIGFEDCLLDTDRRELRRGNELVALEPQVFDVLIYLVENRDRVVSKDDLIASVWGGRIVSESTLTSRINAVRKAIGDSGEKQNLIRTFAKKGFRFVALVDVKNKETAAPAEARGPAFGVPTKPSIAVLPFSNMSGDADQDSFVDGVTEEIITALSRVRWFFVIARGSTFAYKSSAIGPEKSLESSAFAISSWAVCAVPATASGSPRSSSTPITEAMFGREATTGRHRIFFPFRMKLLRRLSAVSSPN